METTITTYLFAFKQLETFIHRENCISFELWAKGRKVKILLHCLTAFHFCHRCWVSYWKKGEPETSVYAADSQTTETRVWEKQNMWCRVGGLKCNKIKIIESVFGRGSPHARNWVRRVIDKVQSPVHKLQFFVEGWSRMQKHINSRCKWWKNEGKKQGRWQILVSPWKSAWLLHPSLVSLHSRAAQSSLLLSN